MRTTASLFAGFIALAVGVQAFIAVFFAPVAVHGDDQILLAWGWVAPFVGLPVGALFALGAYLAVSAMLDRSVAATSFRWIRVSAVGMSALLCIVIVAHVMRTYGNVDVGWSEEVQLSDGAVVHVSRRVLGRSFGRPRARPEDWLPSEFVVEAPKSSSDLSVQAWRSSLRPLVLDRDASTDSWYVIAEPIDCGQWYSMGQPKPPYALYVNSGDGWSQKPMDAKYVGRRANLLASPRFAGEDAFVSVEALRARNESAGLRGRFVIQPASRC